MDKTNKKYQEKMFGFLGVRNLRSLLWGGGFGSEHLSGDYWLRFSELVIVWQGTIDLTIASLRGALDPLELRRGNM
eukprot:6051190-Amphidinium_carterae.1